MTKRYGQAGEINVLLVPLMLMVVLFITAAGFGYWAWTERQDYKNNSDLKSAAAADVARKEEGISKDKAFAEAEKSPFESFDGPETYGSIRVDYPKTWSVYVESSASRNQPLDVYFNPRIVPSTADRESVYALRIEVVEQSYSKVVDSFTSSVKSGKVTVVPYTLPKVPGEVGIKVDGNFLTGKENTGSMVVLPLRDKSIKIWTENEQAKADFNNIILPNLTFVP